MTFCLLILYYWQQLYVPVGLYLFCLVMYRVIILKTIIFNYFLFFLAYAIYQGHS
jgi:hypothetical protein